MVQNLFLVAVVLLGACLGSFLNVVIHRVPLGTFLSGGSRSHCPKCNYQIRWFDNIPVLSWMLLRGACRSCRNPISPRYPLVELLTAALLTYLFWEVVGKFLPATIPATQMPDWDNHWGPFVFRAWFVLMLIACTFIDIDHRILPDVLTKPTMAIGLVGSVVAGGLVSGFVDPPVEPPDRFGQGAYSALGIVCGLALTQTIRVGGSKVFGRQAMGFGDVKFMGAIGAFVGWDGTLTTFFLGSLLGAVYGGVHQWITGEGKIFFGPFLAAGALITLFFKADIVEFVTVTWPQWQATTQISPWYTIGVAVVAAVSLLFIIRRGRRHL